MCGIFGYFDQHKESLDSRVIEAMGESLFHRGPDDVGIYQDQGIAVGNRRLSVIDIKGGHQPFISEDKSIVVVQNGEIFNHVELASELARTKYKCQTHSDTEVILRLYEKDGIEFVSRLNGMFSIAIYDRNVDAVFLIRDRVGVKPLFIYENSGRISFASEIKSLLKTGIPRNINYTALHHFLAYNFVPPPLTMFDGIEHLQPGHWLRIDRTSIYKQCWWELANQQIVEKSENEWISEFNDLLDDAVRLRLRSDKPFGAFLSGGVDSTSVVGMMSRHMQDKVKTFSIGFHEERFDESPFAQKAADRFNTDHVMEKVDANMLDLWPLTTYFCDQPHGDISFIPTYKVSELAHRDVTVVLTGDGADELFAGYDKYRDFFTGFNDNIGDDETFRRAYYRNLSLFHNNERLRLYTDCTKERIGAIDSYQVLEPLFNKTSHMDRINQALYIDTMLLLSGNNLVKPDRMGMAVSLEARTPFLDYRMIEFAFSMPGRLKLHEGETKYIYKKAVKNLIGPELAYRKKQMFTVPVGEWLRSVLAPFAEEVLLSQRARNRELFRYEEVKRILSEHKTGASNYTREIRALISVELWCRIFLDETYEHAPSLDDLGIPTELVRVI